MLASSDGSRQYRPRPSATRLEDAAKVAKEEWSDATREQLAAIVAELHVEAERVEANRHAVLATMPGE